MVEQRRNRGERSHQRVPRRFTIGAFTIAEMADMAAMVFLENAADGQTVEDTDRVSQVVAHFDALRGESLPVGASRDLIVKVAEERWRK